LKRKLRLLEIDGNVKRRKMKRKKIAKVATRMTY